MAHSAFEQSVVRFERRGIENLVAGLNKQVDRLERDNRQLTELLYIFVKQQGGEFRIPEDQRMEMFSGELVSERDPTTGELIFQVREVPHADA